MENLSIDKRDTINGIKLTYSLNIAYYRNLELKGVFMSEDDYFDLSELYNLMINLVIDPDYKKEVSGSQLIKYASTRAK